jgi:hypothetical protein
MDRNHFLLPHEVALNQRCRTKMFLSPHSFGRSRIFAVTTIERICHKNDSLTDNSTTKEAKDHFHMGHMAVGFDQGRINHKAEKNKGRGTYKVQKEGNRPSKFFCSTKNSKSAWGLREP